MTYKTHRILIFYNGNLIIHTVRGTLFGTSDGLRIQLL